MTSRAAGAGKAGEAGRATTLGSSGLPVTRSRSNLELSTRRFIRQRLGMLGLAITLLLLLVAICAPLLAPTSYDYANLAEANQFPNGRHWLGTDSIGHDFLSRIVYGVRTSVIVGFAAVGLACLIGVPLGLLSGLRGGWVDFAVMRVVDVMTAFPGILFAIFLISVLGGGLGNVIFVIGVTGWVTICRLL